MPSSASSLLKVELQAAGENNNSWGTKANGVFSRLEEGIAATTSITMAAGTTTLDDTQYSANQSRSMILSLSGTSGTIVIPNRSKMYFVKNSGSGSAIISTGSGTTCTIPAAGAEWVYCDGNNVVSRVTIPKASVGLGNVENTALSTWTGSTSLTTLGTISSGTWSGTTIAVGKGGTGLTTTPTNGKLLIGNGTDYTLANLTAGSGVTITNGAGSITIAASGLSAPSAGIVKSNGSTLSSVSDPLPIANGGTALSTAPTNGKLLIGNGTGYTLANLTAGSGVSISNGAGSVTISATGAAFTYPSSGIVTSTGSAWGSSLTAPSGTIVGTSDSQTLSNKTLDANCSISDTGAIAATSPGTRGIAQNSQSGAYQLVLSDAGKHISISTGGITVPENSGTAFPVGTAISIYNNSASTQTIAITTDTLRLAGTASTGSRTLAARGICTLLKVASTEWVATGSVS